jgi:hypothetical protein
MDIVNLVSPVVGVGGAVGGYMLKYLLDKRSEAESRRFTDKREHYRNLILTIKKLVEGGEAEELFWFEYSFLWLYAPDTVIRTANTVATILKKSPSPTADLNAALGELLLEMRHDVGFRASRMTSGDYLSKSEI